MWNRRQATDTGKIYGKETLCVDCMLTCLPKFVIFSSRKKQPCNFAMTLPLGGSPPAQSYSRYFNPKSMLADTLTPKASCSNTMDWYYGLNKWCNTWLSLTCCLAEPVCWRAFWRSWISPCRRLRQLAGIWIPFPLGGGISLWNCEN